MEVSLSVNVQRVVQGRSTVNVQRVVQGRSTVNVESAVDVHIVMEVSLSVNVQRVVQRRSTVNVQRAVQRRSTVNIQRAFEVRRRVRTPSQRVRPRDVTREDGTCLDVVCLQVIELTFVRRNVDQVGVLSVDGVCRHHVHVHVGVLEIDVVDAWVERELHLTIVWVLTQVPVQHINDAVLAGNRTLLFRLQRSIQDVVCIVQRSSRIDVARSAVSVVIAIGRQTCTGLGVVQL